jgi:hypothetical protein
VFVVFDAHRVYASMLHSHQGLGSTNPQLQTKVNMKTSISSLLHFQHLSHHPPNIMNCKIHTTMSQPPLHLSYSRSTPSSFAIHTERFIDSTTIKLIIALGTIALAWVILQDDMYLYVYFAASLGSMVRLAWRTIWMWRGWWDEHEDEDEEYSDSLRRRKSSKCDVEMGLEKKVRFQDEVGEMEAWALEDA